jgi:SagB-type dehydrogenase family enzyme
MIAAAPATILMAAVFARLVVKYGEGRSPRYAYLEAGHAAQNVLLQAEALGLGSVAVGAFVDERVRDVLHLPKDHAPLYLLPIGRVS